MIPLSIDEEIENVGEGSGVLCKFKKLDLNLLDLCQNQTLALYQQSKLISISGASYILSTVYVIVLFGLKKSNCFPFGVSSIISTLGLLHE